MNPDKISLRELFAYIADFLLPRHCLSCGKINPQGKYSHFCDDCSPEANMLRGARCLVCSEIVGSANVPDVLGCAYCKENPPNFNRSFVIGSFTGSIRQIALELKYNNGTYILSDINKLISACKGAEAFLSNTILVPVPLHYARKIKRGYNQSELICKTIIKTFPNSNIKFADLLKRKRHTPTQTTLDRKHRTKNVKGAFTIKSKKAISAYPKSTRFIVVDDVMTSSATLSECARILKKFGFENVDAFAFARRL